MWLCDPPKPSNICRSLWRAATLPHPPCPRLWALTRCHYFIVSLHACEWAVQLTLCCSGKLAAVLHMVPEEVYWVWDMLFPGQASMTAHLDPYTHLYPSYCLHMHPTASLSACVYSFPLLKSVVTCEITHICRIYPLCPNAGYFCMCSFFFLRDIRRRKLVLDRMRPEGMVVLANENLLLNFHPPLCQVLELKEIIVGIVYVFRKMNYRWSKTDKVNLCQAGVLLIELPFSSALAVLLHTVTVRRLDTPSHSFKGEECVQTLTGNTYIQAYSIL